MVDGVLLDKLDFIAQQVRHTSMPFGGIQLVFAGDFFQLPPVFKKQLASYGAGAASSGSASPSLAAAGGCFAFEAACWRKALYAQVQLTEVHRQKDPRFVTVLNSLREGRVTEECVSLLKTAGSRLAELGDVSWHGEDRERRRCSCLLLWNTAAAHAPALHLVVLQKLKPTQLYSRNDDVDRVNSQELAKVSGRSVVCVELVRALYFTGCCCVAGHLAIVRPLRARAGFWRATLAKSRI